MARLNLTLDDDTFERLRTHARRARTPPSTLARELLRKALDRREERERARKLAADYAAGRADARALLAGFEARQSEVLGEEDD